ncbi:hypothetical protein N0V88_000154 [Collariella sp. IMI 366227]|nr:hypothetical protein N0V88_000154 [Collariella sp. IMI 366227]
MAEASATLTASITAEDVIGILEIGCIIIGFLNKLDDIRSASLVSKRFNRASSLHLWKAVKMPRIVANLNDREQRLQYLQWQKFKRDQGESVLHLTINFHDIASTWPHYIDLAGWEAMRPNSCPLGLIMDAVVRNIDEMTFLTKKLQSFTARGIPRVLDILRLVQRRCPKIQAINIAASASDSFGLRFMPFNDTNHQRSLETMYPDYTSPLANTIHYQGRQTHILTQPAFRFLHLRVLVLTNLQYDGLCPSPCIEPLAWLLRGSPGLTHLELDLRHRIGGFTLPNNFQMHMHGPPSLNSHMMRALCLQFRRAGGQPLKLTALRLGFGCQIMGDFYPSHEQHYLPLLLNRESLLELHTKNLWLKEGISLPKFFNNTDGSFSLISGPPVMQPLLPNLRKVTWPWDNGYLVASLVYGSRGNPERLQRIIIRVSDPTATDFAAVTSSHCPTWVRSRYHDLVDLNALRKGIRLGGLILPTDFMTPEDADKLLAIVPWMVGIQVLKIRMSHHTILTGRSYKRTYWRRFSRMTDLRELWLADGRGTWDAQRQLFIKDPYPNEKQFQKLVTRFVESCPKLEYLRILDRAWTIVRSEEGGQPQVRALTLGQVEESLPEAFVWDMPKVI